MQCITGKETKLKAAAETGTLSIATPTPPLSQKKTPALWLASCCNVSSAHIQDGFGRSRRSVSKMAAPWVSPDAPWEGEPVEGSTAAPADWKAEAGPELTGKKRWVGRCAPGSRLNPPDYPLPSIDFYFESLLFLSGGVSFSFFLSSTVSNSCASAGQGVFLLPV